MFHHQLREFYVYVHRSASTGAVFYVGKGWGSRGRDFSGRSTRWRDFCGATDPIVQIVDHSMFEADALRLESALISFILGTGGSLANIAVGQPEAAPVIEIVREPQKLTIRCIDHGIDFFDIDDVMIWLAMANQGEATEEAILQALADGRKRAAGLRWKNLLDIA